MTDNTQPEALDLADWLEAVGGGGPSSQSLKCNEFAMTAYQAKSLEAAKAKLSTLIEGETQ